MTTTRIENRLRASSALVALGLLVALASMFWNHPLSFMVFLFVGVPICGIGVLIYLLAIVKE
jgi:hypothetical protein